MSQEAPARRPAIISPRSATGTISRLGAVRCPCGRGIVRPTLATIFLCVRMTCAPLALVMPTLAAAHEPTITVGIVPQRSPLELALAWTPVLQKVGRLAHCHLDFETAEDIPTFQRRVARGAYDLAYLNPYQYVVAHRTKGYQALVRDNGHLRSIIVVTRTSPIRTLAALAHRPIAFPAPGSLAASLLPQALFKRRHIPIFPEYVLSHGSVYRTVAEGLYVAGGGILKTFRDFPVAVRQKLRILWLGPPLPPHPLAVLPTVPRACVRRLKQAFLALAKTPHGQILLAGIGIKRFVATTDRAYDVVRRLPIHPFKASQ